MGNQIIIWRLAVDLSLVTAILVMAFRWMKASRAQAMLPRTLELEAGLRSLISDADAAGRHLNEQLLRREQNLQKLLVDIAEAEGRLNRSVTAGEDRGKEIQIALDNARELIAELKESYKEEQDALRRHQVELRSSQHSFNEPAARQQYSRQQMAKRVEEPEPPMFEEAGYHRTRPQLDSATAYNTETRTPSVRREEGQSARPSSSASQQRVAEPASQEPSRKASAYPAREAPEQRNMQKIYAAAEALLKQGRQLEQVSAQTRLPVEEVRMLSQMIEIEREEEQSKKTKGTSVPVEDSRLGVLGSIRRQTTTI